MHTGSFSDGLSARQYSCVINSENGKLHLQVNDHQPDKMIWVIKEIVDCHLNANTLIIKYGSYPHLTLECSGPLATEIYTTWSEGKPIRRAEGMVFKGKLSMALAFTFAFIGILLLAYFVLLPWAGEKAAALVPRETEIEMGNSIANVFTESLPTNDSATILANDFISLLKTSQNYSLQITVLESEDINAFAVPGGKIFIYSSIIKEMESYEELVALLGHELTHVEEQHSLKSICRSMASGLFVATMFGDITGISSAVVAQADEFKQLSYSRELETEADNKGYDWMLMNEVDPEGMLNLLKLLKREGAETPGFMKYLSTHPDTEARIKNIESRKKLLKQKFETSFILEKIFRGIQRNLDKKYF